MWANVQRGGRPAEYRWRPLHGARWKYRTQSYTKIANMSTIAQLFCWAIFSQACIDSRKKPVKQQYLLQMPSQCGELRPTNSWDQFGSLGHSSKFQPFSRLGFVTASTLLNKSQLNFARCLAVSWAGTLYIHFPGLLPPDGILPGAKFTLRPCLAFSYTGSITARHASIGRQPKFAASYKEWNYGTFTKGATYIPLGGHYVGHCPHSCFCAVVAKYILNIIQIIYTTW